MSGPRYGSRVTCVYNRCLSMIDYNTIQFKFPLDDLKMHIGVLSHYRRSVESMEEARILEPKKDFLGMIINLSGHTHHFRTEDVHDALAKLHYNFFYIPPDASHWQLNPGMNSILSLGCEIGFLSQFVDEVPSLEPFLTSAIVGRKATLSERHLAVPAEVLDNITELMREHQFTGRTRDNYLRMKSGNIIVMGLMNIQASHDQGHGLSVAETSELQRLYLYMVDNLQYIIDTRPLMTFLDMPETAVKSKFKRLFGKSMYEALRYERMKKAEDLLRHSKLQIQEIAEKVGYRCAAAFLNAFKAEYGVYPMEFRKKGR